MPIDYDAIRAENISRYGWDTAVLELLGQLYSDRTHFIFELIQNAEDAGATELTFELFGDRLEVRHDGRPFTEADVRGICGVGQGTKAGDLGQIGKFGIGFKSVYAYTNSPRISSADEHFRIEVYVRPYPLQPPDQPAAGHSGETRFVFPFDRPDVPPELAVQEISAALGAVDVETLLFLRSIERLRTRGVLAPDTVIERRGTRRDHSGRQVVLTRRQSGGPGSRSGGGQLSSEWLVWERHLDELGEPAHRVELAFMARPDIDARRLVRRDSSPLVVSFPTQKETFLGFLIQGPYRTTPARDNVPEHDPWNQSLVAQTASLLAEVLASLRDEGLLSVDILQALPLDVGRFAPGTMFRPLFDAVRAALAQDELIPAAAGGFRRAGEVRLTAQAGVREMMSPAQLGELCGAVGPVAFADGDISDSGTPMLWHYLREQIGIDEVTPRSLVDSVTAGFLAAQPDQWIGRLYWFLYQHRGLWREARDPDEQAGPARTKPIIRLEDGSQVPPFDERGRPAAYLPGPEPTEFRTVRRAVAAVPEAREFLEALGFAEPNLVSEVLDHVLPRYHDADVTALDPAQRDADLELIARALAQASVADRERLMDQLRQTAFLVGENAATGQHRLLRPDEVYLRTRALEIYFDGNPDAWIADDGYGPWLAQLRDMGVTGEVRLDARDADPLGYVLIAADFARNERGMAGFDPAAALDGLEYALSHPNAARSEYVWNVLLVPSRHLIAGVVEKSHRQTFADASRETTLSPIGEIASSAAWLPAPDGTFQRPADLDVSHLPPSYLRDDGLAHALGMAQPVIDEANRQLGFPPEFLRRLSRHPDLVATIEQELKARSAENT
ncbi:MAG TPA: hypothetical protein VF834_00645 [Streptosporangiaceae bacterium]